MKALSKFFTPPLTTTDRETFYECLGFDRLEYYFQETFGTYVLQAKEMKGLEGFSLLDEPAPSESHGQLKIHHETNALPEEPQYIPRTLWEELFPYPFNQIGTKSATLTPANFQRQMSQLAKALNLLEEKMSATEVSCLYVKGPDGVELPLLFHYVRRRRVRVGTAPHLLELGEEFRRHQLTPEALRQHFGTHSAFYYLNCETRPIGIETVISRIQDLTMPLPSELSSVVIGTSPAVPAYPDIHPHP